MWQQPVCFNAIYIKALLRAGTSTHLEEYADRLYETGRDENGWFTRAGRYDDGAVLDTAGALQIFTVLRFPQLLERVV
jgi:hypothetical protein